jgi:hypothetical protein
MRKSLRLFFVSLIVVGATAVVSFAQEGNDRPRNINERQQNQRERIKDGVQNGELNRRETHRLIHEQSDIRRLERRLRNSGDEFTRAERARVQRQLNHSSRHIRRAKRN